MKRRFKALFVGAFVTLTVLPTTANAWVDYHANDARLAGYTVAVLPDAVPVPGTNVYIAPDYDEDIVFYRDYWYRVNNGKWDMGRDYNGPWHYIPVEQVPVALLKLPTDYRRAADSHVKIPYLLLKSNWKTWEDEGRWERHAVKELHRHYRSSTAVYETGGRGVRH